jgi:hypothetical protein
VVNGPVAIPTSTFTPTPTNTPIFVPSYIVTPVIPTFQNPAAGGLFNPIAKTPTPRPQVVAAAPADPGCNPPPGAGVAGVCLRPPNTGEGVTLRPPNTGDAGLKAIEDDSTVE